MFDQLAAHPWWTLAVVGAFALSGFVLVVFALAWQTTGRWLSQGSATTTGQPIDFGLAGEAVNFPARDGAGIAGWWIPSDEPGNGTVVLLNSGFEHAAYLHDARLSVLVVSFRGTGGSERSDRTLGAREIDDALGALDYLEGRGVRLEEVGLQGVSLGGVVAILAAAREDRVAGAVAEAPYADIEYVLERRFRRFGPASFPFDLATVWLWERRVGEPAGETSAEEAAAALRDRPLLIIEDERDSTVLADSIERIRAASGGGEQYWLAPGSRHARAFRDHPEEYERVVVEFWRSVLGD